MLVGERPGDVEDQAGRPFVGPAGRLLRELLAEAAHRRGGCLPHKRRQALQVEAEGKATGSTTSRAGRRRAPAVPGWASSSRTYGPSSWCAWGDGGSASRRARRARRRASRTAARAPARPPRSSSPSVRRRSCAPAGSLRRGAPSCSRTSSSRATYWPKPAAAADRPESTRHGVRRPLGERAPLASLARQRLDKDMSVRGAYRRRPTSRGTDVCFPRRPAARRSPIPRAHPASGGPCGARCFARIPSPCDRKTWTAGPRSSAVSESRAGG